MWSVSVRAETGMASFNWWTNLINKVGQTRVELLIRLFQEVTCHVGVWFPVLFVNSSETWVSWQNRIFHGLQIICWGYWVNGINVWSSFKNRERRDLNVECSAQIFDHSSWKTWQTIWICLLPGMYLRLKQVIFLQEIWGQDLWKGRSNGFHFNHQRLKF